MHALTILRVLGTLMLMLGVVQWIPGATSYFYGNADWIDFAWSGAACTAAGVVALLVSRGARDLSIRDGFVVVTAAWVVACLVGAVPLYTSGTVPTYVDAMFESMSGFTTTGSSVIADFERVSHGAFLWRSLMQWIGGGGIIVFALVILPALGVAGMQLYQREVTGPYHDKLTPRLRDTAVATWSVYILLTVAQIAILSMQGMSVFESVNHAMTTLSTGGYGTRGDSFASFSPGMEWTVTVFMFLGGMNFALHYRALMHPAQTFMVVRDIEWRWYAGATLLVGLAIAAYLVARHGYAWDRALTKSFFNVVSVMTTTGFGSDDFALWGPFAHVLLIFVMLTGGCAGSTSGGIKWVRVLLMFKNSRLSMLRLIHPNVVRRPKINDVPVTEEIQSNIGAFVFLYFAALGVFTVLLSLDEMSLITAFTAALSALGNVGPGLDQVGPMANFAWMTDHAKLLLIAAMLMGRLELMTVLMVILPRTWRG